MVIPSDLRQPDACDRIAAAIAATGADVEYVVNDAGYGLFGKAVELDRAAQLGMVGGQHSRADGPVVAVRRRH